MDYQKYNVNMITSSADSSLYWKRITIPKGLPALLEILAKETIRENPKNIVTFLSTLVDDLIAKRDQEKAGSPAERDKLLQKGNRKNSHTFTDEELAASKIQAGFRGYKTRKSLKSKKRKGSDLSLTSLTPLVQDEKRRDDETEEEAVERKRLEKEVDEAIAAEIKTPLETIREESIDGSYRVKTPDVKFPPVNVVDTSASKKKAVFPNPPPSSKDMADEILEELSEELQQINLLEIRDNLSEELADNNVSLDDAKTESMELEVELEEQDGDIGPNMVEPEEEESDADRKMMEQHVIEVLNAQELGEDDPTSTSQSLGTTDVKGASLEIHESEVETMMLEEDSVPTGEVDGGENETEIQILENPATEIGEDLENHEGFAQTETSQVELEKVDNVAIDETDNDVVTSTLKQSERTTLVNDDAPPDITEVIPHPIVESLSASSQPVEEETVPPMDIVEKISKSDDLGHQPSGNAGSSFANGVSKSHSFHEELSDVAVIDEEKEKVGEIDNEEILNALNGAEIDLKENKAKQMDVNLKPDSIVDVEMPTLSLDEGSSFANNTDSASISSSATTVRPIAFHKYEDSSQDASSLSESPAVVPRPKPRKLASVSFEENKSSEEFDTATSKLSSELMDESSLESPQPVMRRQKSSPKTRGKAVASKYRSGIVMDEEVSMEEMEAQIENDMLSQAATKIQAGFRGYKTRKTMGVSGSGKKKARLTSSSKDEDALNSNANAADNAASVAPTTPPLSDSVAGSGFAPASASADDLDYYITDEEKPRPTLAYLRSRSYPGSHEKEEDARGGSGRGRGTKSTSADGAAAAVASILDHPQGASTPELEYDPAYVNNAAIKIQASVRGFLVRKHSKRESRKSQRTQQPNNQAEIPRVQFDVGDLEHGDEAFLENHPDLPLSFYGVGELIINPAEDRAWRDSASPISDVGSDVAATKIQAAFRGFKDRQKVRHAKKAVVTIQATVRGFLTRRRLLKLRRRSLQSRRRSSAKSMMMSPEVQKIKKANDAATKIQAVYRGYQVRSRIRKVGSDDELN